MMMKMRYGALVLALLLATGCSEAVRQVDLPQEPESSIPDRSSEVIVGQMERADVRRVLGAPKLSSRYWGFDLFCADTEQIAVGFALTPWPVPFARVKDKLQRYTLVAYDVQGRASAVATGLFRKPPAWRSLRPIEYDYPSLHLHAGELIFFVYPERDRNVNMYVVPPGRDLFLQRARASTDCMAVLGCGVKGCSDQLSVDAGPVRRLPVRNALLGWFTQDEQDSWLDAVEPSGRDTPTHWDEALVALKLSAGEHILEFSAKYLGGTHSLRFECRPGEVSYLIISASVNKSFWNPTLVDWQIDRNNMMPERFARRPLVLIDDGQWYVDTEPGE